MCSSFFLIYLSARPLRMYWLLYIIPIATVCFVFKCASPKKDVTSKKSVIVLVGPQLVPSDDPMDRSFSAEPAVKTERKVRGTVAEPAKDKPATVAKEGGVENNRAKWAKAVIQLKCKAISAEFTEKVKKYNAPDMTSNVFEKNAIKNRYTDVLCLDSTRVVLKGRGKDDYIHASWINTPDNATRYICTQGPLPETFEDFWAMVFQEKTKFVIMLCNLTEGGAEKCNQYWPAQKGQTEKYGPYTVKNTESKPEPVVGVKWSVLDVTHKGETFQVYHVFVTWWPDQLAPADPVPMVSLYKWVKKMNEKEGKPILVHCSAGVGRTATFVGIDYANIRIRENADFNLLDVIKEMRGYRYQSIQSHVQYLYLHVCLLEYFLEEKFVETDAKMKEFIEEYQRHAEKKLQKRKKEEKDE